MPYERRPLRAPRLAGVPLRFVCAAAEAPVVGALVRRSMVAKLGIGPFRRVDLGTITPQGRPLPPDRGHEPGSDDAGALVEEALSPPRSPSRAATLDDYAETYRDGRSSPSEVAERVIELVRADATEDPPLLPLLAQQVEDVRRQAEESSARWEAGAPLSAFDGVPVVIKDELHVMGYPTTLGTTFLGQGEVETEDATVVARLRGLGALLVGKANMHELGLGVTGLNPHHGSARNPYDPTRATGGSSSGSAVSVASGLAPAAIGCDGGGSIRIPASLCGAFGLKATFGRVSEVGVPPLCWSVAHAGPLAGSARDLAATYAAVAGRDPGDRASLRQPLPDLAGYGRGDLEGVRIGIDWAWFEDAQPQVVEECRAAVERMVELGASLHEIEVPEPDLTRVAHSVIIVTERGAAAQPWYPARRRSLGLDVRFNYALSAGLDATDYVRALRVRARIVAAWNGLFETVDLIASPATGCTAPTHAPDALRGGESDLPKLERIMRFSPPANLTGNPAISIPVGHDDGGLPVGLQLIARPWEEALLLRAARLLDARIELDEPGRALDTLPRARLAVPGRSDTEDAR